MVSSTSLVMQLEMATRKYWEDAFVSYLTGPSLAEQLGYVYTKPRYMEDSKPRKHEFGEADGKAVLRRIRHGGEVSPALLQRAVKAVTDAAYERGLEDAEDPDY